MRIETNESRRLILAGTQNHMFESNFTTKEAGGVRDELARWRCLFVHLENAQVRNALTPHRGPPPAWLVMYATIEDRSGAQNPSRVCRIILLQQ